MTEYQRDILQTLTGSDRHSLDLSRELRRYIDLKTLRAMESRGLIVQVSASTRAVAVFGLRWSITADGRKQLAEYAGWPML